MFPLADCKTVCVLWAITGSVNRGKARCGLQTFGFLRARFCQPVCRFFSNVVLTIHLDLYMRQKTPDLNRPTFGAATAAFVASLLLGALVSLQLSGAGHLHGDPQAYFAQALSMLNGWAGMGPFYWPPGTALVVASALHLAGSTNPLIGWGVSCLFLAMDAALVVILSDQLFGGRFTVVAAALAAGYPTFLLTAGQTDSHIFGLFWVLLVTLCAVRGARLRKAGWFAVAGLALGMAVLTRPALGLLGLLVPWTVWLDADSKAREGLRLVLGRALVASMLAFVTMATVLVPVLVHNHSHQAGWTISTNNQRNFFLGNNPYTPLYRTWHFASRSLDQLPQNVSSYLRSIYAQPHARSAMVHAAVSEIRHHPARFLIRTINRVCAFWGADYQAARELQINLGLHRVPALLLFAVQAGGYWALLGLALVGTFAARAPRAGCPKKLLWGGALLLLIPYALAFSAPVYHFEALGLLFPLAAAGFVEVHDLVHANGLRGLLSLRHKRALVLALGVFVIVQIEFLLLVRGH